MGDVFFDVILTIKLSHVGTFSGIGKQYAGSNCTHGAQYALKRPSRNSNDSTKSAVALFGSVISASRKMTSSEAVL